MYILYLMNGLSEVRERFTSQACGFMNFSSDNQVLTCPHLRKCSRMSIVSGNLLQKVDLS